MTRVIKDVTVFIADGTVDSGGYSYTIDKVKFLPSVPVTYNFNKDMVIGRASLNKVGKEIHADITLESDMIAELLKSKCTLVPCIGGILEHGTLEENISKAGAITLNTIGLSEANMDKRIKPLKSLEGNK